MKSDIGDHQEFQTRVKGFIFSCFVLCFKIVRFNFIKIHDTKVELHWPSQPRLIMQQMSLFNRKHSQNIFSQNWYVWLIDSFNGLFFQQILKYWQHLKSSWNERNKNGFIGFPIKTASPLNFLCVFPYFSCSIVLFIWKQENNILILMFVFLVHTLMVTRCARIKLFQTFCLDRLEHGFEMFMSH